MARRRFKGANGLVFHAMNRAHIGDVLFDSPRAYSAFVDLIVEALDVCPIRLLAYCLMNNHWHLVLWPEHTRQMSAFAGWLSMTHAKRLQQFRGTVGSGPVYRDRFNAVPVGSEASLFRVIRYVERNPVRAGLVERPCHWAWSSAVSPNLVTLADWPVARPENWRQFIDDEEQPSDLVAVREELFPARKRGRPRKVAPGPSPPETTPGLFPGPD